MITYDLNYRKIAGPDLEIVELPVHVEMYRHREDAMAVVHTHQTYATLMGTLGLKLELLDPSTLAFTRGVPLYDEVDDPTYFSKEMGTLIREPRQGQIAARKMGDSNAIVLKAHGPIVYGKSVEEACMLTIALEVYERYSQSESYLFPHPAGQHSHGDKPCLKNSPCSSRSALVFRAVQKMLDERRELDKLRG